jgi:hypothetical protein
MEDRGLMIAIFDLPFSILDGHRCASTRASHLNLFEPLDERQPESATDAFKSFKPFKTFQSLSDSQDVP